MSDPIFNTASVTATTQEATDWATKAGNTISQAAPQIQGTINNLMKDVGMLTSINQNQINVQAQAKLQTLKSQADTTFAKYGLYIAGAVFVVGLLWVLSENKVKLPING
jgi:hypothetical protein